MKYEPGDEVLVRRTTGSALEQPQRCKILGPSKRSSLYAYQVEWGDHAINVKEDWISPADMIIQELSDTPWE